MSVDRSNANCSCLYLIDCGSDDSPEGAKDDPDGGRDIHETNEVDVVINSIENRWDDELDRLFEWDEIYGGWVTPCPGNGGGQLDDLPQEDQHGLWYRVGSSIVVLDRVTAHLLPNLTEHLKNTIHYTYRKWIKKNSKIFLLDIRYIQSCEYLLRHLNHLHKHFSTQYLTKHNGSSSNWKYSYFVSFLHQYLWSSSHC